MHRLLPALALLFTACGPPAATDADDTDTSPDTEVRDTDPVDTDVADTDTTDTDQPDTDTTDTDTTDTDTDTVPSDAAFVRVYNMSGAIDSPLSATLDGSAPHPSWASMANGELSDGPASGYVTVSATTAPDLTLSTTQATQASPLLVTSTTALSDVATGEHTTVLVDGGLFQVPGQGLTPQVIPAPIQETRPTRAGGAGYDVVNLDSQRWTVNAGQGLATAIMDAGSPPLGLNMASPATELVLNGPTRMRFWPEVSADGYATLLWDGTTMTQLDDQSSVQTLRPVVQTHLINTRADRADLVLQDRDTPTPLATIGFVADASTLYESPEFTFVDGAGLTATTNGTFLSPWQDNYTYVAPPELAGQADTLVSFTWPAAQPLNGMADYYMVNLTSSPVTISFPRDGGSQACGTTLPADPYQWARDVCTVATADIGATGQRSGNLSNSASTGSVFFGAEQAGQSYILFVYDTPTGLASATYKQDGSRL